MGRAESNHSIAGNWLGQYFYSDGEEGSSFEAVFIEIGIHVEGSILDDCNPGEALVNGTFTYPELKFTKKYHGSHLLPVEYSGAMNSDGTMLTGTWWIKATSEAEGSTTGTWIARRNGGNADCEFKFEEVKQELTTPALS
jgi:hypothetical protein